MEDEKKLYPLKTMPVVDGGSTVLLADLGYIDSEFRNGWLAADTVSEVMEMYMDRLVGEDVFNYYGRQFPVMLRVIDVTENTALMVHPDDGTATERYDFLGKAKLWYVLSSGPEACVYLGFGKDVEPADFYMACRHSDAGDLLNRVDVKAGDSFFIAPGTVHAAGGRMKLLEVSECSPLDFRIFNWGKDMDLDEFDSALNLDAAFDFIDYRKYVPVPAVENSFKDMCRKLVDRPEFVATEIALAAPLTISGSGFDKFLVYTCISGKVAIQTRVDDLVQEVSLTPGETVLVPAETDGFQLLPDAEGAVLLEISAGKHDRDSYIAISDGGDEMEIYS